MTQSKHVDIRDLPETLPAFDNLEQFFLSIKDEKGKSVWTSAREGFVDPLLSVQQNLNKTTIKNLIVQRFLSTYQYTLKRVVETKVSRQLQYWIEVNELNDIVFRVFNYRYGGVGVSVAQKKGYDGMYEAIKLSKEESEALDIKQKMLESIKKKLTSEEIAFLRI